MTTRATEALPHVPYQSPRDGPRRGRRLLFIVLGTLLVLGLGISVLLPSMCKAREPANRAKCASNLHQIGLAIQLYQQDNRGAYPDSFRTMMENEQITAGLFVCPSSNDETSDGATTRETLDNLTPEKHHVSYVYLGAGLTDQTVTPTTVVVYERPHNHDDDGMNILFGDGHAEWFAKSAAETLVKTALATTRPTTRP